MGHHAGMIPPRNAAVPPPGTAAGGDAWPIRAHLDLHEELHARPAMPARSPGVVSYWAQHEMDPSKALAALGALCEAIGHAAPPAAARHFVVKSAAFDLKFERHGEFVSWQLSVGLDQPVHLHDTPALRAAISGSRAIDALPAAFVQGIANTPMLAATHVVVLKASDPAELDVLRQVLQAAMREGAAGNAHLSATAQEPVDDSAALLASRVSDGQAALMTDLRLGRDGFTRFLLVDMGLPPDRLARDVQRVCEIEAYRMLAMLGFPVARDESQSLHEIEAQLQTIVDDMAGARTLDDAAAFDSLLKLAAGIEHAAARTRYRLSATRAYHRIVLQRLSDLREERLLSLQQLAGFFNRRFAPAMALCESTDARITDIADRINRAVDLARVRVEAQREANNQELFRSLAHRQKLQLRLQQTVEGLSVVAISYYTISIVAYVSKAMKGLKLPGGIVLQPDVVTALAVLPVVGLVYALVRRVRNRLEK
ncbi:MAG: DUF3422 family protein [Betaproteobacteria bacterium]|nr:DUF3422 family protein [Betaproteobacteria bacterium]NBT10215.1 DUF3422 family protein [Betaproteobacteria bacterium]NBU48538.1 DUF3422 family protein [Betaproteobacteria bacterium]NBX96632.1 DUF3422 family protein [Betaproteobacteria bacterium]